MEIVVNEDREELYNLSEEIDESEYIRENNQEVLSQLKDELKYWARSFNKEIIYQQSPKSPKYVRER